MNFLQASKLFQLFSAENRSSWHVYAIILKNEIL